jgi:hypothetical protein
MIPADIAGGFECYGGKVIRRGALTVRGGGAFRKPWADGEAMAANLFSATTGMRQGEFLAVRGGDIGEAVPNTAHSWSAEDGLKSPKNGEAWRVPLLPEVREALLAVLAANPHADIPEAERFVFWGMRSDRPRVEGSFMLDALHAEVEAMGVDWRVRNIVFHGWRHFYAARMANIEAVEKVSRITGHRSRAVFDAYANHVTEAAVSDMDRAAAVFAGVLAGGPPPVPRPGRVLVSCCRMVFRTLRTAFLCCCAVVWLSSPAKNEAARGTKKKNTANAHLSASVIRSQGVPPAAYIGDALPGFLQTARQPLYDVLSHTSSLSWFLK